MHSPSSSHSNAHRAGWWLIGVGLLVAFAGTLPLPRGHAAEGAEDTVLVVADLRGQALVVFDPVRPQDARRIALPGGPHELARLPDGRVVTSLEQAGVLAVVDLANGGVETVAVGGYPHGLVVQGDVLAFTDRDRDEVRRLRLNDWSELDPIVTGHWPHAVAALPGGDLVMANAGESTLTVGSRTIAVSAMPETVAVSTRGDRIATAGAMGNAVELLGTEGALLRQVEVGGRPVRVAFDPVGGRVAAALSAAGAVAILDAGGSMHRVEVGGMPDGLCFDASGRLLYVSDLTAGRLSVVDVAAGRLEVVYAGVGLSTGAMLLVPGPAALGGFPSPLVRQ